MDTNKDSQDYLSKADMIVQFIKTGEIEDPNLLNDEDAELSDVLDDVLNNYPEDIQTDIFNRILDDEDEEKVEYIKEFIEENMEDVPFDIARDFAIDGSEPAVERMLTAISDAEITLPWDDPILFYKIRYEIENEFPEWRVDDDIIEYLDDDNPALDVVEFFADVEEEYFQYYAARAYHTIGHSLKALETCAEIEELDSWRIGDYWVDNEAAEWFVEALQGALETNEEEAKKIIRNINIDEKTEEIIFEICSEKNPDLAKILHELWEIEEEELSEQEENGQIDFEQSGGKNPKHGETESQEQKSEKDEYTKQELEKKEDKHHGKIEEKEDTHTQEKDNQTEQVLEKEKDTEEQQQQEQGKAVDEQSSQKTSIDTDDANALFALYQEKGGIKILRKAAKLGHAEAQYQLGLHLLELHQDTPLWKKAIKAVKGTKTNKEKAMEWFKNAAKQGHVDAKRMLKE